MHRSCEQSHSILWKLYLNLASGEGRKFPLAFFPRRGPRACNFINSNRLRASGTQFSFSDFPKVKVFFPLLGKTLGEVGGVWYNVRIDKGLQPCDTLGGRKSKPVKKLNAFSLSYNSIKKKVVGLMGGMVCESTVPLYHLYIVVCNTGYVFKLVSCVLPGFPVLDFLRVQDDWAAGTLSKICFGRMNIEVKKQNLTFCIHVLVWGTSYTQHVTCLACWLFDFLYRGDTMKVKSRFDFY